MRYPHSIILPPEQLPGVLNIHLVPEAACEGNARTIHCNATFIVGVHISLYTAGPRAEGSNDRTKQISMVLLPVKVKHPPDA